MGWDFELESYDTAVSAEYRRVRDAFAARQLRRVMLAHPLRGPLSRSAGAVGAYERPKGGKDRGRLQGPPEPS